MVQADNSGPNSRVVEVMNFLAAHPTESFTLSELASRLGLSTAQPIDCLRHWPRRAIFRVIRDTKTYSLGMALVAIGRAALTQHRDVEIAQREMARLSAELKVDCHACAVVGNELLFLASERMPNSVEPLNRVGDRRPYMPPLGMVHAAWAELEEQEDYIARAPAALSDRAREHVTRALKAIRRRGYAMSGSGPAFRALRQFTVAPIGDQDEAYWAGLRQLIADLSEREIQLLDFDEAGPDGISFITVPVFSPAGQVSLELTLGGLSPKASRAQLEHYLERLQRAAAMVTSETHGRVPPPDGSKMDGLLSA